MGTTTLGQRLQAAMQRKAISPADLAREAETTDATISNWLNDNVRIEHVKAMQLFKIAEAAQIGPRELLLGSPFSVAEDHAGYRSHPVQSGVLTIAIQLVEDELARRDRALPPNKRAEAIQLAYDLLEEGMPQAKVLRFVLAAVA